MNNYFPQHLYSSEQVALDLYFVDLDFAIAQNQREVNDINNSGERTRFIEYRLIK